jgi:excisionase family DNA binding protein
MAESRERARHQQPLLGPSGSPEAREERLRGGRTGSNEADWAITPAVLPLERMVLLDVSGDESDPELRAHTVEETDSPPSVLTVEELAALLRVNRKTVYDALARGEIPGARRIGGRYRILRDAVLEWLASSQDRAVRSRSHR